MTVSWFQQFGGLEFSFSKLFLQKLQNITLKWRFWKMSRKCGISLNNKIYSLSYITVSLGMYQSL